MNLHLLIPGLFWPEAARIEIYNDLSLTALEAILAKSQSILSHSQSMEEWLCQSFGVSKQQDWPVAPIMLQLDDTDNRLNRDEFWLRADPVHLRIENNHILLADSQVFTISLEDSRQFAATLNQCFVNRGIRFLPLHPDRWYLSITHIPRLQTRLLSEVAGKNINNLLPLGQDSPVWHNIFNEIQMLLHNHLVNQDREARGELAINSVWFWGGGVMPERICSSFSHIWSDHAFAHALAIASGTAHDQLPQHATAWQQSSQPGNHLIILDALGGKIQYKNMYEWRKCLSILEHSWFAPLLEALKKGKISQLKITALSESGTRDFVMTPASLWKFWARTKSLSSYAK